MSPGMPKPEHDDLTTKTDLLTKAAHAHEQYQWWKQERRDLVQEANNHGWGVRDIAYALGVPVTTIRRMIGS